MQSPCLLIDYIGNMLDHDLKISALYYYDLLTNLHPDTSSYTIDTYEKKLSDVGSRIIDDISKNLAGVIANYQETIAKFSLYNITSVITDDCTEGVNSIHAVDIENLNHGLNSESLRRPRINNKEVLEKKCIVVTGESGVGKTVFSTGLLPSVLYPSANSGGNTTVVFYTKPKHNTKITCREIDDNAPVEKRNETAMKLLMDIWKVLLDKLYSQYPKTNSWNADNENWKHLRAVLVLDEMGAYPNLLRGIVAVSHEFQKVSINGSNGGNGIRVLSMDVVLVGTALDFAVRTANECQTNAGNLNLSAQNIASDTDKFVRVALTPWDDHKVMQFFVNYMKSNSVKDPKAALVSRTILRIHILRTIAQNARCAFFLMFSFFEHCSLIGINQQLNDLSDSFIEEFIVENKTFLYVKTAAQYRNANGIGSLCRDNPLLFNYLVSCCFAVSFGDQLKTMDAITLLRLGMLTYNIGSSTFEISPPLLLFMLSRFNQFPIARNSDSFEMLVGWMEAAKAFSMLQRNIGVRDANFANRVTDAINSIIVSCLRYPILSTVANANYVSTISALNRLRNLKAGEELPADLRSFGNDFASVEACLLDKLIYCFKFPKHMIKDNKLVFLPDKVYILINGPRAPFPDVIVIDTRGGRKVIRFLQAKFFKDGFTFDAKFESELFKLGYGNSTKHVVTYEALRLFAESAASVKRVLVTSKCFNGEMRNKEYYTNDAIVDAVITDVKCRVKLSVLREPWCHLVSERYEDMEYASLSGRLPDVTKLKKYGVY